ncbi:MAG: hypothetical protein L3K19_08270 [Thermoplasmata archaeon]|nr:hypothetical protein [Thermoplasmata archaeon]
MADDWALLTFSCNDGDAVVANIDRLRSAIDEVVVIDSSDSPRHAALREAVERRGGRVVRVLPLGNGELFRPFGITQVQSGRTLWMDADERPSSGLIQNLRSLTGSDAYILTRLELSLHAETRHLRIFRTAAVGPRGLSYRYPPVSGSLASAPSSVYLEHDADFRTYLGVRRPRYRSTEWAERPFTSTYLRSAFTGADRREVPSGSSPLLAVPMDPPLSMGGVRLAVEIHAARETLSYRSVRFGRFRRSYEIARAREWARMTAAERSSWLSIASEVQAAGGLPSYLGLTEAEYVIELSRGFGWDREGPAVLSELIRYRHAHGRPRPPGPWDPVGSAP